MSNKYNSSTYLIIPPRMEAQVREQDSWNKSLSFKNTIHQWKKTLSAKIQNEWEEVLSRVDEIITNIFIKNPNVWRRLDAYKNTLRNPISNWELLIDYKILTSKQVEQFTKKYLKFVKVILTWSSNEIINSLEENKVNPKAWTDEDQTSIDRALGLVEN